MNRGTKFLLFCFLFFLFIWISLHILLPLTLPFLLGTGLALLAEPGVRFLRQKTGLPRAIGAGLCVSTAFLLLSGAVFVLCALLLRQLQALGTILPNLQQTADDGLALLKNWLLELSARALPSLRPLLRRHILTLFSDSTAFLRQGISYILGLAGGLLSRVPDQAFTLFTAVVSGFMAPGNADLCHRRVRLRKIQPRVRGAEQDPVCKAQPRPHPSWRLPGDFGHRAAGQGHQH